MGPNTIMFLLNQIDKSKKEKNKKKKQESLNRIKQFVCL